MSSKKQYIAWTDLEDAEIKRLFLDENKSVTEIHALMPNRTVLAIKTRLNLIGIKRSDQIKPWSPEEDKILRECFEKGIKPKQMTLYLNRGAPSISYRKRVLGLYSRDPYEEWDQSEDNLIRDMSAKGSSVKEIANAINRSVSSVYGRAKSMGLNIVKQQKIYWTKEEDEMLKQMFNQKKNRMEMAAALGRNFASIANRLNFLDLKTRKNPKIAEKYTPGQISLAISLYEKGVRTKEIEKQTGMTESSIYYILNKNNVPKRRPPLRKDQWTQHEFDEMVRLLDEGKSVEEVSELLDRGPEAVVSACRKLGLRSKYQALKDKRNRDKRNKIDTFEGRLRYMLEISERRAVKIEMGFDLNFDVLKEVYVKQGGKCYYSGIEMSFKTHDSNLISIDRIDSKRGYLKDNIVLSIWRINFMKQDLQKEEFLSLCSVIAQYQSKSALVQAPLDG